MALFPLEQLSLSADLVLARWGRDRTVHNEVPPEPLSDLWQVRAGVEWTTPFEPLQARIGYGYEPSPIPPQEGETNLLGGSAHVLATGIGFDLRALDWAALRLDTHVRAQLLETQQDEKQLSTLPDVRPDEPGRQIDNLGYPGFTAGGSFWQVGLTATIFLGSKSNAEAPESKRAAEPEDKP